MIHKFGIRSIETMRKVDAMSHNSNTVEAISYDVAHCINAGIESCLRQIIVVESVKKWLGRVKK
jgi:hypothetical protein